MLWRNAPRLTAGFDTCLTGSSITGNSSVTLAFDLEFFDVAVLLENLLGKIEIIF